MFYIICRNDSTFEFVVRAGPYLTLEEAKEGRWCSGDLVVDHNYLPLVSQGWLFHWEKLDSNCYANRMIRLVQSGNFRVGYQRRMPPREPMPYPTIAAL